MVTINEYYNSNKGTMTTEVISDNKFIINLTIDGTSFEGVEVIVPEPNKTLREQINRIVSVFELPVMDTCGNPMQYLLGQIMADGEEPVILEFEDEDGREQCLMDYNVQSGDYLHLIPVPAYACPIPMEMEREWVLYCMNKK